MRELEKEGRTVEEAVEEALQVLNASLSDVDVEVLDQGSRGILGLFGGRSARVRLRLREVRGQQVERIETFLRDALRLMRVDARVERLDRKEERNALTVDLAGPEVGILIGRRGQTLDALQHLANIAGNRGASDRTRVMLDAEGFRARREESLRGLAKRTAGRVKSTGQRVGLDVMNAMERRIVHVALADEPGIETYSEGEEPHRKVVVTKAGEARP